MKKKKILIIGILNASLFLAGCAETEKETGNNLASESGSNASTSYSTEQNEDGTTLPGWREYQGIPDDFEETQAEDVKKEFYEMPVSEEEKQTLEAEATALALTYKDIYARAEKGNAVNIVIPEETREEIINQISAQGYVVTDLYSDSNMKNYPLAEGFCEKARNGEEADVSIYQVHSNGGFSRTDFHAQNGEMFVTIVNLDWTEETEPVVSYIERYQLYEWNYTEKGYFLYERYVPEGLEMNGRAGIRIKPLNEEYSELCKKYIEPIGYQRNNLFLENWEKDQMEAVDFNDLFESVYYLHYGKAFDKEAYENGIPKEEFETLTGAYFPVTGEWLEEHAFYDEQQQSYDWHELGCGTYSPQPIPFPEVTGLRDNQDGTITLVVDAVCPEYGTDQAFIHEVTIKMEEDGSFHYLSNQIRPSEKNIFPAYESRSRRVKQYKNE